MFYVHPYLGKDSHFDVRIFFNWVGWTHQLLILPCAIDFSSQGGFKLTHALETASFLETSWKVFELDHHCLLLGFGGQCSFIALGQSRRGWPRGFIEIKSMDLFVLSNFCCRKKKTKLVGYRSWLGGGYGKKSGLDGYSRWLDSSYIGGFNGFLFTRIFSLQKFWGQ